MARRTSRLAVRRRSTTTSQRCSDDGWNRRDAAVFCRTFGDVWRTVSRRHRGRAATKACRRLDVIAARDAIEATSSAGQPTIWSYRPLHHSVVGSVARVRFRRRRVRRRLPLVRAVERLAALEVEVPPFDLRAVELLPDLTQRFDVLDGIDRPEQTASRSRRRRQGRRRGRASGARAAIDGERHGRQRDLEGQK